MKLFWKKNKHIISEIFTTQELNSEQEQSHLKKDFKIDKKEKSFTDDINAGEFASKQMILLPTLKDIEYHIKLDIETYSPNRVLIVPLGKDFRISIMEELKSSEKIARRFNGNINSNENYSLKWLSQAASQIRKSHVNSILISNYPRDTNPPQVQYWQAGKLITSKLPARTSLRICDKKDTTSLLAIYLVDIYSKGYIDNLFSSQARDRENLTRLQVLVPDNDLRRHIPEEERSKIKSATNKIEQHQALENLASKLELEPEISFRPSVFQGPILTE